MDSITDDSACISTVESTFALLAGQMGSEDTLFCYTWGHGGHDDTGDYPTPAHASHFSIGVRPLGPPTPLWDTAFGRMANAVNAQRVFIMQQCYSGGFVDDIADSTTTIVCASPAGKSSFAADNNQRRGSPLPECDPVHDDTLLWHSEFNYHFMNAARGKAIWPYTSPPTVDADEDNDGYVSLHEAYYYVDKCGSNRGRGEIPVFFSPDSPWVAACSLPRSIGGRGVKDGAALAGIADTASSTVFAIGGNKSRGFYAFEFDTLAESSRWVLKCSVPPGTSGKGIYKGGALVAAPDGHLYATKGNRTREFWRFGPATGAWAAAESVPLGDKQKGVRQGAAAVAVQKGGGYMGSTGSGTARSQHEEVQRRPVTRLGGRRHAVCSQGLRLQRVLPVQHCI